jgi:hypothetical protein
MMILSIMYMSAIIVVAVSAIASIAIFKIDKNADRNEDQ